MAEDGADSCQRMYDYWCVRGLRRSRRGRRGRHLRSGHAGEVQEVWASGQGTCVTLDQAYESSSSVNSDDVVAVTEDYPRPGLGS